MGAQATFALPTPGDIVDRYRVLARVAHGGMASVFAVRRDHARFDKLLALKLLLPHLREQTRFVEMFFDEARIAAHVSHENVVQVFDIGEHEGSPYIVMEYLGGVSLATALAERPLPVSRAVLLGLLASVAEGLHAAHLATGPNDEPLGIVHRDVSPQNVMLCFDGRVKVVDFGIAAAKGRLTSTRSGEVKGKISYLAPEQLDRSYSVEPRTDLWAFGVMAWQALADRPLFQGESHSDTMWNIMNREVPDLLEIDESLPVEVIDIIEQCLERKPFARPTSAAECAAVLREASGLSEPELRDALASELGESFAGEREHEEERTEALLNEASQVAAARPEPPRTRSDRRRWGIVAALAVVTLAGVAVWLGGGADAHAPGTTTSPAPTPPAIPTVALADEPDPPRAHPVAEPTSDVLELDVPEAAILVLVDGRRDDARPLRLTLDESTSAEVVVVTSRGETTSRVDAQSPRAVLVEAAGPRLGRRSRRRPREQPPEQPPQEPARGSADDGLLPVTFR